MDDDERQGGRFDPVDMAIQARRWWEPHELQARIERFDESAPGRFWGRLSTVDFLNSSLAFAALAVISVFPLFAVGSTVLGGDVRNAIVGRMGLNASATRDVEALIA